MLIQHVNGHVKTLFGESKGRYTVFTFHRRRTGSWIIRVENSKGRWKEFNLPSEIGADCIAAHLCSLIRRYLYVF